MFSIPPKARFMGLPRFLYEHASKCIRFSAEIPCFRIFFLLFCLLSSRFPLIFLVLRTIYINTPPGVFIPVHDLASFRSCGMLVRFKYVVYKTAQLSKYMDNFESHLNKLINFNFRAIIWIIFVDIYLIKLYNFCNLIE